MIASFSFFGDNMPEKKQGESKQDYVSRAIPIIKKEHPKKTMKQVVGQAYGMAKDSVSIWDIIKRG